MMVVMVVVVVVVVMVIVMVVVLIVVVLGDGLVVVQQSELVVVFADASAEDGYDGVGNLLTNKWNEQCKYFFQIKTNEFCLVFFKQINTL